MIKTDRRVKKTKDAIKKAFIDLLKTKDPIEMTVTELAKIADIDRKTFYSHYDSIGAIMQEFREDTIAQINDVFKTETFTIQTLFTKINDIVKRNYLFYSLIVSKQSLWNIKNNFKNTFKNYIITSFYKSSKMDKESFYVLAEYVASGIIGVYIEWFSGKTAAEIERNQILAGKLIADDWNKLTGQR